MWYNNLSFVLLGILAISVLIPLHCATRRGQITSSVIDGVVLALLGAHEVLLFRFSDWAISRCEAPMAATR